MGFIEEFQSDDQQKNESHKPAIIINRLLNHQVAERLMDALLKTNDPPYLFRRGRELVRIENGSVLPVDVTQLMDLMDYAAVIYKVNESGEGHPVNMPRSPAKSALTNVARYGFPELKEVIHAPLMLANGQILDRSGYDPTSKFFLALPPGFQVLPRSKPSKEAAKAAYAFLARPLKDFPYSDEASRANVLGFIFGVAARNIIDAMLPLALVVSPAPDTGKTTLCKAMVALATGMRVAVNSWPDGNDQLRKLLLSNFLESPAATIFDNVAANKKLNPASLNTVLTSGIFKDRILQRSKNSAFDLRGHPMLLNGNRLRLVHEFARRCVVISFQSKRTPPPIYEHAGEAALLKWCIDHRSEVNAAILTILESWLAECECNGAPGRGMTPDIDSFEAWTQIVSSIMWFCEQGESFLAGRDDALAGVADDTEIDFAFIGAVQDAFKSDPFRAGDLWAKIEEGGILNDLMPPSLIEMTASTKDRKSRAVGDWLQQRVGSRFGPDGKIVLKLENKPHRSGVALYKLVSD